MKWYTPLEGVEESLFAVMINGEPVAYTGAIYKRPAPTGQDYIQLKAGESITSVINLGEYYDLSQSGEYEIVASTDDYVYGQSGAMQLAGSDPNKAVDNADNHEYFAENNPFLP